MEMNPVYTYIDFRKYLADYYDYCKKNHRHFSHRWFAQKAGLSSSSFYRRVVDGKRNLTPSMIEKFTVALKLNAKESLYFRHLVRFNQAITASEKSEHYAVLRSLVGAVREKYLQADQYDYFKNWYTPVMREIVCLVQCTDDFSLLGRMVKPPISAKEAREALQCIKRLGLVKKNHEGRYFQTDLSLSADPAIRSMAVRAYTDAMLGHGRTALNTMPAEVRHISTMTLGISREQYAVLVQELESFKDRVKGIVTRDDKPEQVYELNFSLFPVSVRLDGGGNENHE
jgi:uncharacterized protein (TIGR02147 family)